MGRVVRFALLLMAFQERKGARRDVDLMQIKLNTSVRVRSLPAATFAFTSNVAFCLSYFRSFPRLHLDSEVWS